MVVKVVGAGDGKKLAAAAVAAAATVTTVPQQQKLQQKTQKQQFEHTTTTTIPTSSSLLNSSPTALAKFNRIIDNTVSSTNYYQHQQQRDAREKQQQQYEPALSSSLQKRFAARTIQSQQRIGVTNGDTSETDDSITRNSVLKINSKDRSKNLSLTSNDDNQTKRNDVHYLLKQLNSFSDIEEIEIVDMKQIQRQQQQKSSAMPATSTDAVADYKQYSPTATSLVMVSPSALSHKGIRRYASLHYENEQYYKQQQQYQQEHSAASAAAIEQNQQQQHEQQQFNFLQYEDYIFQSSHYLETNCFATTYSTAMAESSSHEFRPSTTTATTASSSSSAAPDAHAEEPQSVIAAIKKRSLETLPTAAITIVGSKTQTYCETAARLSSGGHIQTELTATSMSLASSLANTSMKNSSSSSGCSSEERRKPPFFKCCYTPIDRWREKRSGASGITTAPTNAQQQQRQQKRQQQQHCKDGDGHAV